MTGLKPSHFYNIRVVAVGANNFSAASQMLRLRTYNESGKPDLGGSRLPQSFAENGNGRLAFGSEGRNMDPKRSSPIPAIEAAAAVLDGRLAPGREGTSSFPGQRRNTLNRRHSPSVASADQPNIPTSSSIGPDATLDELNRKFEAIRKEIDEVVATYNKEEAEFLQQEAELKKEKERKKQLLKEKEEQTSQLKTANRTTQEQMRNAEKERNKKEQQLKEKEAKKKKIRDNIAKYESEIERMQKERESFAEKKKELEEKRDCDVAKLDETNSELQEKCAELEAELRDKGKQLQELKEARQKLPGADDEQSSDNDAQLDRHWETRRNELHHQLVSETKRGHFLDQQLRILSEQLSIQQQSGLAQYNQPDPSAPEFEPSNGNQSKRLSHHSNTIPEAHVSPSFQSPGPDSGSQMVGRIHRHALGPALFMDMTADGDSEPPTEAELRAASGPMSPTAQGLLPAALLDDTENLDSRLQPSPLPAAVTAVEDDPQSPGSSTRSYSVFSSPQGSSHNLPFPSYLEPADSRPVTLNSSPTAPPAPGHRFSNLFSFNRNRAPGHGEDGGLALGSLKPGQSQSFPRVTDETELANRRKPSWGWPLINRNSMGPDGVIPSPQFSAARFLARKAGGSSGESGLDRDTDHPRPASVTSTDLPRPSTDSSSIWGPQERKGPWSPSNETRWASRSGSRRPSLQGPSSKMTTTLASAEDEILDDADLLNPQKSASQVGVIGSRPPARTARSIQMNLNPNAPTFMGNVSNMFRKDKDKDSAASEAGGKSKGKDKSKDKSKGKNKEVTTPSLELPPSLDDSPTDSRISRDTYSVHTQTSVSESHDSLPLDHTVSNSASDANLGASSASQKEQENKMRKLFRKGSSSKFSLSGRLGKDSPLFKKGPSSTANSSDKNTAEHRSSIGDLDDLGEEGLGTSMSALGRSYDSMASSPSLGPARTRDSKESRMSGWRNFSMKKKGKETPGREKESMEMDRAPDEE